MFDDRAFLGQVPLVLGPGSWGFPGMLPPSIPPCPAGTFMDEDGFCRPTVALGRGGGGGGGGAHGGFAGGFGGHGGFAGHGGFSRPVFRGRWNAPYESGFCGPEEVLGADGNCYPLY